MKQTLIVIVLLALCLAGCRSSGFKAALIIEGQPCPYAGVVVSPQQLVDANDPAPMTGVLVWWKNMDELLNEIP